jgi:DNA-binding MarR family transcriptional regulator
MINGILSSTMLELPSGACELYEALRTTARKLAQKNNLKPNEVSFTQREIREATGYGQSWIKQNLRLLADYEYVLRIRGGERSKSAYRLREDEGIAKLDLNMIPTPEAMEQLMNKTGQI